LIDEGYIKFDLEWQKDAPLSASVIADINYWRQRLYEAGLIGYHTDLKVGFGNISVRYVEPGQFIISGTQTGHLPVLSNEHYALVTEHDVTRNHVTCRGPLQASSESLTHAVLYDIDSAIQAVVHVHSKALWQQLMHQVPTTDASVSYGTPEMAREFTRLYRDTDFVETGVAVMAGHDEGIISVGASVKEAAERILEIAEREYH
jgi:L-ribulose-5-phosphate 4-epimerase